MEFWDKERAEESQVEMEKSGEAERTVSSVERRAVMLFPIADSVEFVFVFEALGEV